MKLAVSTYSLARWRRDQGTTLEDSLRWIADAGVDAVEFTGFDVPETQISGRASELRRLCRKLGLKPVGYCVGAELLVPFSAQRDAISKLRRHVDAAAELGVPSMRHDV